jgi:four helix bundle protein
MNRFKSLKVWQEAVDLAVVIYKITSNFPSEEKFGLTSQIRRSVVSISSNIAEGSGRNTNKDFDNFLGYAVGSTFELESQLIVSEKLGFLNESGLELSTSKILHIQNMLFKLKSSLENKTINKLETNN